MSHHAEANRESARRPDGKFGHQHHSEAEGISLVLNASGPATGTSDAAYDDFIAEEAVRLVRDPEYLDAQMALGDARRRVGVAESAEKFARNDIYLSTHRTAEIVKDRLKSTREIRSAVDEKAFGAEAEQLANKLAFFTPLTELDSLPAEDAAHHLMNGAGHGLAENTYTQLVHRESLNHPKAFTDAVSAARSHQAEKNNLAAAESVVAEPMARLNAARAQRDQPQHLRRDLAELHDVAPGAGTLDLMMAGFPPAGK